MPNAALPFDALRAIWRALTDVPGLHLKSSELVPVDGDGPDNLALTVRGWSPTLHACDMLWNVPVDVGSPRLLDMLTNGMHDLLETQRRRAASAYAYGIPLPADVRWKEGWRQLHADSSHLACHIHSKTEAQDALWQEIDDFDSPDLTNDLLKETLGNLQLAHDDEQPHDGGRVIRNSGCMGMEVDGLHVIKLSSTKMLGCERREFSIRHGFRGETILSIRDTKLPASVIGALAGRHVGEVVFLHRLVNGRRIAAASGDDFSIELELEPEYVAYRDLADLDVRQTLKLLDERACATT